MSERKGAMYYLRRVGDAIIIPIAILPAAGIFLALGASFASRADAAGLETLGLIFHLMETGGNVIFANLPLLFAIGISFGLANNEGAAALSGLVAYIMMNAVMGYVSGAADIIAVGNNPAYGMVMGIPTMQTGVFGGVIAGLLAAWMYNKFSKFELPPYLGFFSGKRFVPIVTAVMAFILGLFMPIIWKPIGLGLNQLSYLANDASPVVSTLIYGMIERSLVPFGLHHIFYSPFWFQFGDYTTAAGELVHGDLSIYFAMLKDGVTSFSTDSYQHASKFMTGKFPFMMFGLPGAALAMYHCAFPENKKIAGGILFSAALTSFLTGITEPIEFSFLFVAPILYGIHIVLCGISFMLMYILNVNVGMTFSGGFIDFVLFGILPTSEGFETNWYWIVIVGAVYFVIYYLIFTITIKTLNLPTPGREKRDFSKAANSNAKKVSTDNSALADMVLQAIGGSDNLLAVEACITKLRMSVKDTSIVDEQAIKDAGAAGIIHVGENGIYAVFGAKAQFIATEMAKYVK